MTQKEQIANAINVFGLCVNLQEAISSGRLVPITFKKKVKIETGGKGVTFHNNYTQDALRIHSKNLLFVALGTTAIILDTALDAVLGAKDPNDTSQKGSARAILYMVRCAFAHNMVLPTWSCKAKYQRTYTLHLAQAGTIMFDGKTLEWPVD
jgi:hypothetical protein